MSRALLLLGVLLAGCAAPPPPRVGGDPDLPLPVGKAPAWPVYPTTVDLVATDADLADVCERISLHVGRNILVDPAVRATVSVRFEGVHWREAVATLAEQAGCEEEPRCSIILLTRPWLTLAFTDASVRTLLHLLAAYAGTRLELPPYLDASVTIAKTGSVRSLFQAVVDAADLPYDVVWGRPIHLRRRPPVPLGRNLIELHR